MTIPYTKGTWTDGATLASAARFTNLETGIYEAQLQPAVSVSHGGTQTIPHNTTTILTFTAEEYDTVGGAASTQHDTSTNPSRLTALYAGRYAINGGVEFTGNATGFREAAILLNGSTVVGVNQIAAVISTALNVQVDRQIQLAVNDYVELRVYHNAGTALNIAAQTNRSPVFSMHRFG